LPQFERPATTTSGRLTGGSASGAEQEQTNLASCGMTMTNTGGVSDQSPGGGGRPGWLVGLTGGIAAGKSTVGRMFGELGAGLLDADAVAREVVDGDPRMVERIATELGGGVVDAAGRLDRKALAALVFREGGEDARRRLERITHPAISRRADEIAAGLFGAGARVVLYEAALLVETGRHLSMDALVVVVADDEVRLERLVARSSLSRGEALARFSSQMPQREKAAAADFVIDNSGDLEKTRGRVAEVFALLLARATAG
jgi:dephospho-CoA kinase